MARVTGRALRAAIIYLLKEVFKYFNIENWYSRADLLNVSYSFLISATWPQGNHEEAFWPLKE